MVGSVYKCLRCKSLYSTSFSADGLSCPFCLGPTIRVQELMSRDEYKKIISKTREDKRKEERNELF